MASSAGTFLSLFHRRKRQQNCYQQKAFAINCIHAIKKTLFCYPIVRRQESGKVSPINGPKNSLKLLTNKGYNYIQDAPNIDVASFSHQLHRHQLIGKYND